MNNSMKISSIALLLSLTALAGCGGESAKQILDSAKSSLEKGDRRSAVIQIKNALQKEQNYPEARFLLAKTLLESGDAKSADIELGKARDLHFDEGKIIPLAAQIMLQKGEWKKLIDQYKDQRLSDKESQSDLAATLASAYSALGQTSEARSLVKAALAETPEYPRLLLVHARLLAADGNLPEARAVVEQAKKIAGERSDVWLLAGEIAQGQKDFKEAELAYAKAIKLNAINLQAHVRAIEFYSAQKDVDGALRQWEQLKKQLPGHPQTLYYGVLLAYEKKDLQLAEERLQPLLKIAPDDGRALFLAGAVKFQKGAVRAAHDYLSKSINTPFGVNNDGVRMLLARVLIRMGDSAKALATLQPLLSRADVPSEAFAIAGEAQLMSGETRQAEGLLSKAVAKNPADVRSKTALALAKIGKGNVNDGVNDLRAVSASDPGTVADLALVATLLRAKNYAATLTAIEAWERKRPDDAVTAYLKGDIALAQGDAAKARGAFELALQRDPQYFPAARGLADLDLKNKQPESAIKRFELMSNADPRNLRALMALIGLRAANGASKEATQESLRAAVRGFPSEIGPRIGLIRSFLDAKDTKQALAAAQDAVSAIPDRPELLEMLGTVHFLSNDFNQAVIAFGRMSTLQPESAFPLLKLANAQMADKNVAAAVGSLKKALAIQPDYPEAQSLLVSGLVLSGKLDEARSVAKTVQSQRPKEAIGFVLTGDIETNQRSWAAATKAYQQGLERQALTDVALKLHRALEAGGKVDEMKALETGWLQRHASDALFMIYLGDRALTKADYSRAEEWYGRVLTMQADNVIALNNMAWLRNRANKSDALDFALKANKQQPDSPPLMDTLAEIYAGSGDYKKALEVQRRALDLAPGLHVHRLHLARYLIKSGQKDAAKEELKKLAALGDGFSGQAEVKDLLATL